MADAAVPAGKKMQGNKPDIRGLAGRLDELRGDLSVSAFARKCGVGESLMRKYLAGASPSADKLAQISGATGATVDWIATGEGPKQRDAIARIGLARDAVSRFVARRSVVPEARIPALMEEAFRHALDVDGLERAHGGEFPLAAAQTRAAYGALNVSALLAVLEAVEARMPRVGAAAKASAATALYEHAVARGVWDSVSLQAFLDLIAGAREEGAPYKLPEPFGGEEPQAGAARGKGRKAGKP